MNFSSRREPTFYDGARDHQRNGGHFGAQGTGHDDTYPSGAPLPHAATSATGFTRFVSTLQIVGSLLAVPLGLASGYSIYRANFSPETTCQTLRSNIIGMLDKNVDATTRRMLVRRDIEAFEQNCGAVDPDAHAAFKTLLAEPVTAKVAAGEAAEAAEAAKPAKTQVAAKPAETTTPVKSESKPSESKPKAASIAKPEPKAASDARWLAAVRQALVAKEAERTARAEPAPPEPVKAPRVVLQPAWNVTAPAVVPPEASGRALPVQPQAIAQPVAQPVASPPDRVGEADHPVPPASIPVIAPVAGGQPPVSDSDRSRLGTWIAQIPLVGRVIDPRGN